MAVGARRAGWTAALLLAAAPSAGLAAGIAPAPPVILVGEGWTAEERGAVGALLARWPAALRPSVPREIARDAAACDEDGLPDDAAFEGESRLHLCPARPGDHPGAVAEQMAVALAYRFELGARWSEDPAWRRFNGWAPALASAFRLRPENEAPAGFASARGRRSPRWDLATTLGALALEAAAREGTPAPAGSATCRLLSQAVYLHGRLVEAARARGQTPPPPPLCAPFQAWADLDRLADVELVLAAPSTAMIGSLFGHLFLRLVYRDETGETPVHLSRSVAFLADNDVPFHDDPAYAIKGIAGSYQASLHERAFLDSYREYVVLEGRDLRRWRVDLGADGKRALLERIWTVARGGRYRYYFFRRNCATLMIDLLNDARAPAPPIAVPGALAAPPAAILEPWERARGSSGGRLLQLVPDPILSFDREARLASRRRRELERPLLAAVPAALTGDLEAAVTAARSGDPKRRAIAYERVATLLVDRGAGSAPLLRGWLRDSATIESHLSTIANAKAEARAEAERRRQVHEAAETAAARVRQRAADLGAQGSSPDRQIGARLAAAVGALADGDAEARLQGYRALRPLIDELGRRPASTDTVADIRRLALFTSEARYDVRRMKAVPGLRSTLLLAEPARPIEAQPYLAGSAHLLRRPVATAIAPPLAALQRAKQRLYAARNLAGAAGFDERAAERHALVIAARRDYTTAIPRSGLDRFALLAGASTGGDAGSLSAGLALTGALYDERLGEHRRFGFAAETAFTAARTMSLLGVEDGRPALLAYEARLFGYRSLRRPLPESGVGRWPFGWELYADLAGSRRRGLAAEGKLGWGLLAPLAASDDLGDHLLASLSLSYEIVFPASGTAIGGQPHLVGVPAGLELRAGLGSALRRRSWLAARLWAEPKAVLGGAPRRLVLAAGASVELHLSLSHRDDRPWAFLVRGSLSTGTLVYGATATEALLAAGIAFR